jgi:hypothetical protein
LQTRSGRAQKGFSTTLERVGKAVKGPKEIKDSKGDEDDRKKEPAEMKSKKKSLDELLDGGMI